MWCLDPVVCLPLVAAPGSGSPHSHDTLSITGQRAPQTHGAPSSTDHGSTCLSSDSPITAMAWLPGLASAPEPEPEAVQLGHTPHQPAMWTSFMACATQGCVSVHALQLPYLAVGSWEPTPRHVQVQCFSCCMSCVILVLHVLQSGSWRAHACACKFRLHYMIFIHHLLAGFLSRTTL